uniref:Uncharacterized protein n=1 Tax=Candidatus Kentrum sp. LPFa TaxID=2126335 RepID=A0A450XKX2_9GAMM|nr:MAG: hypothetical protein BECKLPF1236A_GA0070988_1005217 [Candidatus Kentron sp. LPFa]VFK29952.1 MAG: hypothetical protein BECKLPF1236C_GA0070990_100995 [Candidatus Kentron sp. LPFa]
MKMAMMAEINRKAETLLIRELGVADTLRFLNRFDHGEGDYTAERHQWLDDLSLDDIRRDIEENADTARRPHGKRTEFSVKVESVGTAYSEVVRLLDKGQRDRTIKVAEYVLNHGISGSSDDFRRLGARLAREGLYRLASKIVLEGLARFPKDLDLLLIAIEYLTSIGDADTLRKVRERFQRVVSGTILKQASGNSEWLSRSFDNLSSSEKIYSFPLESTNHRITPPKREGTME